MTIKVGTLARAGLAVWFVSTTVPALGQAVSGAGDPASRLPDPQINPTGQPIAPGGGEQAPLTLWVAYAQSDNVARATGSGRGAYSALGTAFNLVHDRGRLEASLLGSMESRRYVDDIAEDEVVGNIAASAEVDIVVDRFSWLIGESYVQGRSDPFGADTIENRENVSIFATGPDVNLALGDRTSFGLSGTFSDRTYDASTYLDSQMLASELGLYRQVSPTMVLGLAASVTDVEYEDTTSGYDIEAAFLSYERVLASGNVEVSAGSSTLITTQGEVSEPYLEVNWVRSLTGRSSLTLNAVSGFTDSGRLLELRPDQVAIDVLLTADATNRQHISLEYQLELDRSSIMVGTAVLSDEFAQNTALDSDGSEVHLEVTHRATQRTTLGGTLLKVSRDFTTTGDENEESFARLWVNRRFGEHFSLEAHVQRSETPGVYTERLYQLTMIYTPGRSQPRPERIRPGVAGG